MSWFARTLALYAAAVIPDAAGADVIRVPSHHPAIQEAIDAAEPGDTVLVEPGIYLENLDFHGKAITVTSEAGPETTVVDGQQLGPVAQFATGEGRDAELSGFTLRNGLHHDGGGVWIVDASPTVRGNIIRENVATWGGGGVLVGGGAALIEDNVISANVAGRGLGVDVQFSAATVRRNVITENVRGPGTGGGGGGIWVGGQGTAKILENLIADNSMPTGSGGGIALFAAGTPEVRWNVIVRNDVTRFGGGIYIANRSDALIAGNLIAANRAGIGGGIYWGAGPGRGPRFINNTIAGNHGEEGSALHLLGGRDEPLFLNNLFIAIPGDVAVFCEPFTTPSLFAFNDAWSAGGTAWGGSCPDQTGIDGNVSLDPLFVDPAASDFHLRDDSPVIDAGLNGAEGIPERDLDGDERIQDGNGSCPLRPVVDMGADEFVDEFEGPLRVSIDVRLGDDANVVDRRKGSVDVALLGSEDFEVLDVDVTSLIFGPAEAAPKHSLDKANTLDAHLRDVNDDGFTDLISHYRAQKAGFDPGVAEVVLAGATFDGTLFEGCDVVTATP
jgi:nitrous oxidase accessory protein NosD